MTSSNEATKCAMYIIRNGRRMRYPKFHAQGLCTSTGVGKRVALIGFPDVELERMCLALERIGARPRSFAVDDSPESGPVRDCSVAVVHVAPETVGTRWLSPMFSPPPGMPLVFVGERGNLLALDPAVQSHAREFLIDAWQPEEFLMRLRFALAGVGSQANSPSNADGSHTTMPGAVRRTATSHPEVLIADDDHVIQILVKAALQNYGMECRVASSGIEAMQILREHPPHAVVLDVNMPVMNRFEVLAAIREGAAPIRVIILTARQQEEDLIRAFNLGADDYIVKPFNPKELVLRLKRLL